jgi:hypothetical protein
MRPWLRVPVGLALRHVRASRTEIGGGGMTLRAPLMMALALGLLAAAIAAEAQQAKVARIGWLDAGMTPTAAAPSGALRDFEERLRGR